MTTRNSAAPAACFLLALVGLWPVAAWAQTTFVSTLDDPDGQNAQAVGSG